MKQHQNSRGFSHHFLLPIIAIVAVGAIGIVTLKFSSAAVVTEGTNATKYKCTKITFGRYKNNPAYAKYAHYKSCVKAIQKKVGSKQDGIYGNNTQRLVKQWQSDHGLTADGVVGTKTWTAMGIRPTYKKPVKTSAGEGGTNSGSGKETPTLSTKKSCISGYVNRTDTGDCVKVGALCSKPPLKNPTWQRDGTCKSL